MKGTFKQCPNGHYYEGDQCPYCRRANDEDAETVKTAQFIHYDPPIDGDPIWAAPPHTKGTGTYDPTIDVNRYGGQNSPRNGGRTMFGYEDESVKGAGGTTNGGTTDMNGPRQGSPRQQGRAARKMVGWLVSYTLNPAGVDYKLYEGRNIIGQDASCSITVPDPFVSATHAVLLFRADRYSLTDQQSSHGTYVNDEDIELEPRYLEDGDVIKIGKTVFKFKSSL